MSEQRRRGPMGGRGRMMSGEKAKDFKGSMAKLFRYMGRYKFRFILMFIFAVAGTVFSIVGPKILGKATTELFNGLVAKVNGTGEIDFGKIGMILLWTLGLYVLSACFSFVQGFVMSGISNDVTYNLRKDISKKIYSCKHEAMEKGIPAGNVAYGYKVVLDENKVRVVVEDKEAADVVRWIFNEAEKGILQSVIAEKLNAEHILTPSQYRVRNNKEKLEKLSGVKWTVDTLSQILKNEVYIGKYVTGKDRVCLYRHEKRHMTSKDEWNVFENHHTPLVTKEQFYAVQKNKRKALKPAKKQTVNMLKGKITCGCCGNSIHIHPEKHAKVYMCTHRKRYGRDREIAYNRYLIFDDKNHLIWVFWHEGVKNVEKK